MLENQIDSLDFQDKHYERKFSDLQRRLDKMYDNIHDTEIKVDELKDRKKAIDSKTINMENIYLLLQHFDQLYNIMEDTDKRALLSALVKEVHIYEEERTNGQWLKKIIFNLPLIAEDKLEFSLDNKEHVEAAILMTYCGFDKEQ